MSLKNGKCHCGAVQFEVNLPDGLQNIRRCNCSLCRRKGAVMASALLKDLRVISGKEVLHVYSWNSHTAKHYFCGICGIYTHHQRRSNPNEYGFNIACLEGIDPYEFEDIMVGDGASQPIVT